MKNLAVIDCQQGAVRSVRYNVDGDYVLSSGSNKTVKLWNPNTQKCLKTYSGHGYEVMEARGSCDNSLIISCSMDKTVIVWDVSTGVPQKKLRHHAGRIIFSQKFTEILNVFPGFSGAVNCVSFNEESTMAMSGSIDCTVCCWDLRAKSQEPAQVLNEAKDSVTCILVTDHEIITGSADGKVRTYDLRNGRLTTDSIARENSSITSLSLTSDGQCFLVNTSHPGDSLKLMDKMSGGMLNEYTGNVNTKGYRLEAALDHDSKRVYCGSEDGKIYQWDFIKTVTTNSSDFDPSSTLASTIHSLSYHPTEHKLAAASKNKMSIFNCELAERIEVDE